MNTKLLFFALLLSSYICLGQNSRIIENIVYKPTESEKGNRYYNEAHDYFEKKNYEKAVELYKLAIIEDPNFIDAYDNLGLSYRHLNLLDNAESYYLLSHSKYPKGALALQNLAVVQDLKGNPEGAITSYKQLIELEPEDPEGYYGLSRMQLNIGKYDEAFKNGQLAEKYYKQANSPYIGDCHYLLCIICSYNKYKKSAKEYLTLSRDAGITIDKSIEEYLK